MKKHIVLNEYKSPLGIHTITINNIRYCSVFGDVIRRILKAYLTEQEVQLGFYRIDGVNLSSKEQKKLENEIPITLKKHGELQKINDYLSIARINLIDCGLGFILSIFDYYLETIMFNSKTDLHTFKQYHSDYQKHKLEDLILNGFTDILFCYSDSSDFSICFDTKVYDPIDVRDTVTNIINNTSDSSLG